jgi:hypothetical protein
MPPARQVHRTGHETHSGYRLPQHPPEGLMKSFKTDLRATEQNPSIGVPFNFQTLDQPRPKGGGRLCSLENVPSRFLNVSLLPTVLRQKHRPVAERVLTRVAVAPTKARPFSRSGNHSESVNSDRLENYMAHRSHIRYQRYRLCAADGLRAPRKSF